MVRAGSADAKGLLAVVLLKNRDESAYHWLDRITSGLVGER